jgi:hypothetical protein
LSIADKSRANELLSTQTNKKQKIFNVGEAQTKRQLFRRAGCVTAWRQDSSLFKNIVHVIADAAIRNIGENQVAEFQSVDKTA